MYSYRMSMLGNHVMSSKVYVRFWKYCSRPGFNDNVFTAWQAAVCTFSKLRNDQHDKVDGQLNSFVISTMYEFNKCVIHTIKIYHLVMYIISIFSIAVYEVGLKISNTRKKWSQDFHKVQIMIVSICQFRISEPKIIHTLRFTISKWWSVVLIITDSSFWVRKFEFLGEALLKKLQGI